MFTCECGLTYPLRKTLQQHKRLKHGSPEQFACQHCVYVTNKRGNLEQHVKSQHMKIKEIYKAFIIYSSLSDQIY